MNAMFSDLLGLVHTCKQNSELVSIDKVLRLFIDKLGTNRMFCNYPLTKTASLWSPTADGKPKTYSATFRSVKLVRKETLQNLQKMFAKNYSKIL